MLHGNVSAYHTVELSINDKYNTSSQDVVMAQMLVNLPALVPPG